MALGEMRDDPAVVKALGYAALHDRFWGVRVESLKALGKIGGNGAEKQILAALTNEEPWVRKAAVQQLGNFPDDSSLGCEADGDCVARTKLTACARLR